MTSSDSAYPDPGNRLLERIPIGERDHLLARFEHVELHSGTRLISAREPPGHVYFPSDAFISLIASAPEHASIEVGLVGREGMVSAQVVIDGGTTNTDAVVQGAGSALSMEHTTFRDELAVCPALDEMLRRYLRVVIDQTTQNVVCNSYHRLESRLARWLLMSHDRVVGDTFHLTQEFLAYMLGVRRASVVGAASALQRRGLIHYRRGVLAILDRRGLEAATCSCYATDIATYDRVMTAQAGH